MRPIFSSLSIPRPRVSSPMTVCVVALGLILGFGEAHALPRAGSAPGPACASRGAIDSPASVPLTQEGWHVAGWAYDAQGVAKVRFISSSGELLANIRPTMFRQDVSAALGGCPHTENTGFSVAIPASTPKRAINTIRVEATTTTGKTFPLGTVATPFTQPLAALDEAAPIGMNARNIISGWAFQSEDDPVVVRLLAGDQEIGRQQANSIRADVASVFKAWPSARRSGFHFSVSFKTLPRGRYSLKIVIDGRNGQRTMVGPEVVNDAPIGVVLSTSDRMTNPREISLKTWAYDEDGIATAELGTEEGLSLGKLHLRGKNLPLASVEKDKGQDGTPRRPPGSLYDVRVSPNSLPDGLHRLVVRLEDTRGNKSMLPGPMVLKGASASPACDGEVRHVFLPGGDEVFRKGFPQLKTLKSFAGGCIDAGLRGRVEYLRTTRGRGQDFEFNPDFPEHLRKRNDKEMTGESLNGLLDTAVKFRSPLLITLDGGVWADAKFSAPDLDAVDFLEEDERAVQWNQFGRSEADTALQGLAGSVEDPQLARMMSLNRFNTRFLAYKKRNLQAAIRHIVVFMKEHPDIYVAINLDPDEYINPWFYLKQWYDYNPDTLRQFREWLFHTGPYADGGLLAAKRHEPRLSLANLNRLAHTHFRSDDEVDPPRASPDYDSPWHQIWTQFKRHLVAQHYEDLATWANDAGMPSGRIYTSQTFIQTDVSVNFRDRASGWTDEAGVSIHGAKPGKGHIGAILYGPASRNEGRSRNDASLIDNIRRIDDAWGSVEFHPATIETPERMPSHEIAYLTLMTMLNGGARFLSPMWGSHARDQQVHPERFRAYDVFDGSPFEYQLLWWMRALQTLPVKSLLFPFGNPLVASADGWQAVPQTRMTVEKGFLRLEGRQIALDSPVWHGLRSDQRVTLKLRGNWPGRTACATLWFDQVPREACAAASPPGTHKATRADIAFPATGEIRRIGIRWQAGHDTLSKIRLDEVRIEIK